MASNIAKLPETMKIRTSDNEVVDVTGKLINESYVVKKLFEKTDNSNNIKLSVTSFDLKNVVATLELCDLETPHVPVTAPMGSKALVFENQTVMQFFKSLQGKEVISLCNVADSLECQRIIDLCFSFIRTQAEGLNTHEMRQRFGLRDDYTEEEETAIRNAYTVLPKRHEASD